MTWASMIDHVGDQNTIEIFIIKWRVCHPWLMIWNSSITGPFYFFVHNFNNGRRQVTDDEGNENGQYHFGQTPITSSTSRSSGRRVSLDPRSGPDQTKSKGKGQSDGKINPCWCLWFFKTKKGPTVLVHGPEDASITNDDGQTRS